MIEIIVALGITMVVLTALLPQLLVGIKASGTARLVTQAKGVAQGQLERMRNLPYHVAKDAGDYRDVLDYYFRNLAGPTVAPTCTVAGKYAAPLETWSGYVGSGSSARCAYEPPTGALYRVVGAPSNGFTTVVTTQFLSGVTPPIVVTPPAAYDTQATGRDTPVSTQIGVTVTVLYSDRQTLRPVSTYTRIADQAVTREQLKVTADAAAIQVGSVTPVDGAISLEAGLLHLAGSLTYASTAGATLAATSAGIATGAPAAGASATLAVPPATVAGTLAKPGGDLTSGCSRACWGATRLDLGPASSQSGLPNLGALAAPMQTLLTDRTNGGLVFDNGPASQRRPELALTGPLMKIADSAAPSASGLTSTCGPGAGTPSYVTASGFVRTTSDKDSATPSVVEACALTHATTISLFPTTFAPRGVIQIELRQASARCLLSGVSHAPTVSFDYRAVVRYHLPGADDTYTQAAVISPDAGVSVDPLEQVDLQTPVGGGRSLGDYIDSWSSLQRSEVESTSRTGLASVKLPGVVTMITQPVRTGTAPLVGDPTTLVDLASSLSLTFGVSSCAAQDAR